jgi:hypothetical protein
MTLTLQQQLALLGIFTSTQFVLANNGLVSPQSQAALQVASQAGAPLGPNQLASIAQIPNPPIYPCVTPWTPAQLAALYPSSASWPSSSFN